MIVNLNLNTWKHDTLPEPTSFVPGLESNETPIAKRASDKELLQWESDLIYHDEPNLDASAILALIKEVQQFRARVI